MPKPKRNAEDLVLKAARDADYCPIHARKGKMVYRPSPEKMTRHYEKKHPNKPIPDKYYTGPRDMNGLPIPMYTGKFVVGSRVKLVGKDRLPKTCILLVRKGRRKGQLCKAERPEPAKMRKHIDKKHPGTAYPTGFVFTFHNELGPEIENGDLELPVKGTVFGVTPAAWGGPSTPAIIHVRLDKPIDIHASGRSSKREVYYSRMSMSCVEEELRRFKPKK